MAGKSAKNRTESSSTKTGNAARRAHRSTGDAAGSDLLDMVELPYFVVDSALRVISRAATLEREIDNALTTSSVELFREFPDLESIVRSVLAGGSIVHRQIPDTRGTARVVRVAPYTLDDGSRGAIVLFPDDRRESPYAAPHLATEQRLRITQDEAPVGVRETDLDGRYLYVNDRYCEITGYTRTELLAKRVQDITHPEDAEAIAGAATRLRNGEIRSYTLVKRIVRPDGDVVWTESHGWLVESATGSPSGVVGIVLDVTKRRLAELALAESEQRFQMIADSAPVLIWMIGSDGMQSVNRGFLEFVGVTKSEVLGDRWQAFIHPDDRDVFMTAYREAIAKRTRFEVQFRLRGADGEYRWMKSNGNPRFGAAGRLLGFVGSSADVSDLKRAEEELRETDGNKNRFLAILAHELRGPLAPLRNAAHLLSLDTNPAKIEWTRSLMERQIAHISRMVDDLLDISRVNRGKIELDLEAVDLVTAIHRASDVVRPNVDHRGQTLTLDLPSEELVIEADPVRLEQVFVNLLTNASKFTTERGHIAVVAKRMETERLDDARQRGRHLAEVRIRDDGEGIDPALMPHIFDAFVQADRTLERSKGGLGIGLTLVKSLVELHGGTIEATSDGRGRGSEFILRFPLRQAQSTRGVALARGTPAVTGTRRRVLVVDDNSDACDVMALLLRRAGHDVETARDGDGAERTADAFGPDVILLDIGLPGVDGFEVAQRLRRRHPAGKTALIAISGYGQDDDRRRAQECGFDGYFTKPVGLDTLRELLERLPAR